MLKIFIPLLSLIMLSKTMSSKDKWSYNPLYLMLIMIIYSFSSPQETPKFMKMSLYTDLMSNSLILLTLWISALMILASNFIFLTKDRTMMFLMMIISLSLVLTASFSVSNLILFFIFFETSLIPTVLLILGWGYQPERLQAGIYLLMYTITASLPLLLMIAMNFYSNNNINMILPQTKIMNFWNPMIISLMTIMAFMVKMPLFLTHLWLPKAHVEAPVAGSMILAGLLLKLGSYGLLRLTYFTPMILNPISKMFTAISLIGAMISSMICLRQTDMKSLIAYSSVGHMGLVVAGMLSNSSWGWEGALILMIAHGLCSSSMFYLAYSSYTTTNTRSITLTKGLLNFFPILSMLWFMFSAFNMAAPPSINLAGEIILITSILSFSNTTALLLMIISFLTAAYSLILYSSITHGTGNCSLNTMNHYFPLNYLNMILHFIPMFMLIFALMLIMLWL